MPGLRSSTEIVSVCTYPLVAHHQDEESYEGARKYIIYLTTTAKFFLLPALILIYVLAGTLDFPHNIASGIIPTTATDWVVTMLYVFCIFGFAKNGVMPFHHYGYGEERLLNISFYEDSLQYNPMDAQFRQPTLIFQGLRDASVDHRPVERFAALRPNVTLSLLDDDHSLDASLPRIWDGLRAFLELS